MYTFYVVVVTWGAFAAAVLLSSAMVYLVALGLRRLSRLLQSYAHRDQPSITEPSDEDGTHTEEETAMTNMELQTVELSDCTLHLTDEAAADLARWRDAYGPAFDDVAQATLLNYPPNRYLVWRVVVEEGGDELPVRRRDDDSGAVLATIQVTDSIRMTFVVEATEWEGDRPAYTVTLMFSPDEIGGTSVAADPSQGSGKHARS